MKSDKPEMEDIVAPSAIVSAVDGWNENTLRANPAVGSTAEREIHGPDGEVIKVYGAGWRNVVDFSDPNVSTLILAPTQKWICQIKDDLANAFPGIPFVDIKRDRSAKRRVGTIRDAKETEADTVVLFMAVPEDAYRAITNPAVRNDILRMFYVGTTRARTKLVEVYGFLRYSDGNCAPAPLDLIR